MRTPFRFTTDTSTLAIFDLAALRHRLDDDAPDWWVFPDSVQVDVINSGSAAFVDLGADGVYEGELLREAVPQAAFDLVLECASGQVFVGAGEETTADGLEPDCTRGGLMLALEPGSYHVSVKRSPDGALSIGIVRTTSPARNAFTQPLRLR